MMLQGDASGLGFRYSEQASRDNGLGTHLHPGSSGRHSTMADAGNAGHRCHEIGETVVNSLDC